MYIVRIHDEVLHPKKVDPSINKIRKIKKIIKNVYLHAGEVLPPIVSKLKSQCTFKIPNEFRFREHFFVDLP
jgi:hypothetical protein